MGAGVYERVVALLSGVSYDVIEHDAGSSAVELARARGTALHIGGKALVLKLDAFGFAVLALRADRSLDNRALRKALGLRRYRFVTLGELLTLTGLAPGCVPPFGRPVFDLPLFADDSLASGEAVAFTPGRPTTTFVVPTSVWLGLARPERVFSFTTCERRGLDGGV